MLQIFYISVHGSDVVDVRTQAPPLSVAIPILLAAKKEAGRRSRYVYSLKQYLQKFAEGRESVPISLVSTADIEQWFATRKEPPASKDSNLGRLSALFSYARRRGWIEENPADGIERARIDNPPPLILTVEESHSVMSAVQAKLPLALPYVALALFAGIRPEEIRRLDWDAINLDVGTVTINADKSKTHQRRIVHLMPNTIEWLRLGGIVKLSRKRYAKTCEIIREAIGREKLPKDVLRHSAASYLLAHLGDIGKVATELGNSVGILQKHYLELVPKSEAEKFWNIRPI